jgi:hypothetical protein
MALLGTLTMFAPAGSTPTEYGAVAAQNDSGGRSGPYANGTGEIAYSHDSSGPTSGSTAEVADFGTWTSPKAPAVTPSTTDQGALAAESIVPSAASAGGKSADDTTANGQTAGVSGSPQATGTIAPEMAPKPASTGGAGGVRIDPRLIGLAGFAVLAALGLFLMVAVPRLSGRRTHR